MNAPTRNWRPTYSGIEIDGRYKGSKLILEPSANHEVQIIAEDAGWDDFYNAFDLLEAVIQIADQVNHEEAIKIINEQKETA